MDPIPIPEAATTLLRLAVAAAAGFLIGFEREQASRAEGVERAYAGARTFTLAALAGAVFAIADATMLAPAVGLLVIGSLTIVAWRVAAAETDSRGGTTEMALLAAYGLGLAAAKGELLVAAAGAVAVASILSLKPTIVRWSAKLTRAEAAASLRLLAVSILVLPVLPDAAMGPYGAINPRAIWLVVVSVSGLSFAGYWLTKGLGPSSGALLTGLVGGLASSTAATASLARAAREGRFTPSASAAGIVAANIVMLARIAAILAAVSRPTLAAAAVPLAAAGGVGAVAGLLIFRWRTKAATPAGALALGNPFELKPALTFAAIVGAVLIAAPFAAERFGAQGLLAVSFLSGLADVDAVAVSAGGAAFGASDAVAAVAAAVLANFIAKSVIAATIGGRRLGALIGTVFAGMAVAAYLARL